jgi:hypothetical protein
MHSGLRIINRLSIDKTVMTLPEDAVTRIGCHILLQCLPDDAMDEASRSLMSLWEGWQRKAMLSGAVGYQSQPLPCILGPIKPVADAEFEFESD